MIIAYTEHMSLLTVDLKIISWLRRSFLPIARIAIFIVFFYFGLLKLVGESPASPIALALTGKTVGAEHFDALFYVLALFECLIGLLFLIPKATRVVIPLLILHIVIVSSPLLLVPELAWSKAFVPTLEGQYIIKNVAIIALAIGVASQTTPLSRKR
jgi:uncharacterized membrane protein YkgB